MNTGYKQAVIAFKVDVDTGDPLDINGVRTAISGRRQAIMLLTGTPNPDASAYEVQAFFAPRAEVDGEASYIYAPVDCPVGVLRVTPAMVVLVNEPVTIVLTSSQAWNMSNAPFYNASAYNGPAGEDINITLSPSGTRGQGYLTIVQALTGLVARVYVVSTDNPNLWVLDGGTWQDMGFWFDNGIWNY